MKNKSHGPSVLLEVGFRFWDGRNACIRRKTPEYPKKLVLLPYITRCDNLGEVEIHMDQVVALNEGEKKQS